MVERATRWENLVSLYILVEQSFHVSSGVSTSRLLSEKEKQIYLHIVHTTVIRVSIFCKTYILTVIEFDTCIEVASIINPKIPDDQKIQINIPAITRKYTPVSCHNSRKPMRLSTPCPVYPALTGGFLATTPPGKS